MWKRLACRRPFKWSTKYRMRLLYKSEPIRLAPATGLRQDSGSAKAILSSTWTHFGSRFRWSLLYFHASWKMYNSCMQQCIGPCTAMRRWERNCDKWLDYLWIWNTSLQFCHDVIHTFLEKRPCRYQISWGRWHWEICVSRGHDGGPKENGCKDETDGRKQSATKFRVFHKQ